MDNSNNINTDDFLDAIAGFHTNDPPEITDYESLYQLAVDNKMALHFLDLLNEAGAIGSLQAEYEQELDYYERFEETLVRLATLFEETNTDYCLVKTVSDYRVVPKDVDGLVFEDVAAAEQRMLDRGYHTIQEGPLARTLIDEKTDFKIDLQEELCLRKVKYIDRGKIRKSVVEKSHNGVPVRAPSDEMELAIYIIHSLSEQIYVLREFFVVDTLLRKFDDNNLTRFSDIVQENYLIETASAFFTIQAALYQRLNIEPPEVFSRIAKAYEAEYGKERKRLIKSGYELPHRYTNQTILKVMKEKMREKNFREGWYAELSELKDPETFLYVVKKFYERQVRTDYTSDRYLDEST